MLFEVDGVGSESSSQNRGYLKEMKDVTPDEFMNEQPMESNYNESRGKDTPEQNVISLPEQQTLTLPSLG